MQCSTISKLDYMYTGNCLIIFLSHTLTSLLSSNFVIIVTTTIKIIFIHLNEIEIKSNIR